MNILFKKDMLGLDSYEKFQLSDLEDMEPFKLLQSEDEKDIGMVVVSPFLVVEDYEIKLSDEVVDTLEIKSPEEVSLYTTVTINSDVKKITTNLKAPIVINNNNGFAMQIILQSDKYKIKHPIAF
ncbi:MAG: flagellar assembly protein FliW [Clostridiaceae bacterium]|nr:flagellar assembly protein FliW [Clostridiaceae bacterium]